MRRASSRSSACARCGRPLCSTSGTSSRTASARARCSLSTASTRSRLRWSCLTPGSGCPCIPRTAWSCRISSPPASPDWRSPSQPCCSGSSSSADWRVALLKTSEPARTDAVVVDGLRKTFTLRHTHSFKETFLAALRRKPLTTQFQALEGVSFSIKQGESVALLGYNGSGKSTMLKLISGVLSPDEGKVLTRGRVAGLIEVGAGFHPDLSGRENVYLNAAILGMSKKETDALFDDIVAFSEIEAFIDTEVKHYSSGMFLRLAFSVAIHTEVDILLIDEILAVGDEPFQQKCLARIRGLHDAGKTLVVVSHDLDMVSNLCQRGVLLRGGSIAFDGDSKEAVAMMRAG
ncbi:ABC transporter ATP-binding protein [Naasia lichenicola]|uniref:ABC transporter ATP-binding protein n=1 Tax=Naasia lichenicola TaxID=2565933 RepID=A0A4S4FKX9_9MICO|nr:ABC transporter ATP-binding protein [Naasia lichenicola]